jgi:hypothetical protein
MREYRLHIFRGINTTKILFYKESKNKFIQFVNGELVYGYFFHGKDSIN